MKFFIFAFLIIFSFDIYAQTTTTPNAVKASSDTVSVKKNTPKSGTATSAPSKTTGNTASVQDTSKSKSSFVKVPVASKTSNPETALNSDSSATKSKAKTVVSNSTGPPRRGRTAFTQTMPGDRQRLREGNRQFGANDMRT